MGGTCSNVFANCQRRFRPPGTAAEVSDLDDAEEWAPTTRMRSRSSSSEMDTTTVPATGDDCSICLMVITVDCTRTRCGHHFHQSCFEEYLTINRQQLATARASVRDRCPICRGSLHIPLPVEASATSGRRIEVTDVPAVGSLCHFDRGYTFRSLGDFQKPGMLYILTSNEDRRIPSSAVMWTLEACVGVTVHLNFRSDEHVARAGTWLSHCGYARNPSIRSTVSTGIPNGPYSGPVFSKSFPPGKIKLMGSNTWEGVYFVFVEIEGSQASSQIHHGEPELVNTIGVTDDLESGNAASAGDDVATPATTASAGVGESPLGGTSDGSSPASSPIAPLPPEETLDAAASPRRQLWRAEDTDVPDPT